MNPTESAIEKLLSIIYKELLVSLNFRTYYTSNPFCPRFPLHFRILLPRVCHQIPSIYHWKIQKVASKDDMLTFSEMGNIKAAPFSCSTYFRSGSTSETSSIEGLETTMSSPHNHVSLRYRTTLRKHDPFPLTS